MSLAVSKLVGWVFPYSPLGAKLLQERNCVPVHVKATGPHYVPSGVELPTMDSVAVAPARISLLCTPQDAFMESGNNITYITSKRLRLPFLLLDFLQRHLVISCISYTVSSRVSQPVTHQIIPYWSLKRFA